MKLNKSPFKWRQFEPMIILLCVRWYCRYSLSYRDLEEMMRARAVSRSRHYLRLCENSKTTKFRGGGRNHYSSPKISLQVKSAQLFSGLVFSVEFSHSLIFRWVQRWVRLTSSLLASRSMMCLAMPPLAPRITTFFISFFSAEPAFL